MEIKCLYFVLLYSFSIYSKLFIIFIFILVYKKKTISNFYYLSALEMLQRLNLDYVLTISYDCFPCRQAESNLPKIPYFYHYLFTLIIKEFFITSKFNSVIVWDLKKSLLLILSG